MMQRLHVRIWRHACVELTALCCSLQGYTRFNPVPNYQVDGMVRELAVVRTDGWSSAQSTYIFADTVL